MMLKQHKTLSMVEMRNWIVFKLGLFKADMCDTHQTVFNAKTP